MLAVAAEMLGAGVQLALPMWQSGKLHKQGLQVQVVQHTRDVCAHLQAMLVPARPPPDPSDDSPFPPSSQTVIEHLTASRENLRDAVQLEGQKVCAGYTKQIAPLPPPPIPHTHTFLLTDFTQLQTLMLMATLLLGIAFSVVVEGTLPTNVDKFSIYVWTIGVSLAFFCLFISTILLYEIQNKMSSWMKKILKRQLQRLRHIMLTGARLDAFLLDQIGLPSASFIQAAPTTRFSPSPSPQQAAGAGDPASRASDAASSRARSAGRSRRRLSLPFSRSSADGNHGTPAPNADNAVPAEPQASAYSVADAGMTDPAQMQLEDEQQHLANLQLHLQELLTILKGSEPEQKLRDYLHGPLKRPRRAAIILFHVGSVCLLAVSAMLVRTWLTKQQNESTAPDVFLTIAIITVIVVFLIATIDRCSGGKPTLLLADDGWRVMAPPARHAHRHSAWGWAKHWGISHWLAGHDGSTEGSADFDSLQGAAGVHEHLEMSGVPAAPASAAFAPPRSSIPYGEWREYVPAAQAGPAAQRAASAAAAPRPAPRMPGQSSSEAQANPVARTSSSYAPAYRQYSAERSAAPSALHAAGPASVASSSHSNASRAALFEAYRATLESALQDVDEQTSSG